MRMQWRKVVCALAVGGAGVMVAASPASAGDDARAAAKRGREIAAEADARVRGFGNYRADMKMELSDRRGKTTERKLEVSTLEVSADKSKSLVYFESPRDIRGTALLTFSHRTSEDEQWLYLPALRRTKRIASSNRSTPFMGSEFAYEDLSALYVDDYTYRYVGDESLRDVGCFVIERVPTYDGTGYSKQRVWIDEKEYRVLKVEYWDRDGKRLKTMLLGRYAKYLDRFWMPGEARMVNHQTRASTRLVWSNYQFGVDLKDSDFGQNALRRAR